MSPVNKKKRHKAIHRLYGLYAIADTGVITSNQLENQVAQALKGGAALVQYRDKTTDGERRETQARALLEICRQHQVPLIVNDDVQLAYDIGADGVHLGRDDMPTREARQILGEGKIIGVSCYNEFSLALRAQQSGADYVAFGSFFPSKTKPGAVRAVIELLHSAKAHLDIPVAAIGGITLENGRILIEAGADMLAVIDGLFGQEDVMSAAEHYARLFQAIKGRSGEDLSFL